MNLPNNKLAYTKNFKEDWKNDTEQLIKAIGIDKVLKSFFEVNEKLNEEEYKQVGIFPSNKEIKYNLKITEIADKFGLKPLGRKLRVCPFHKDKNPSLSLSDEKGVFNCFGCGVKGKTDKFYAMLKKLKNGNN